MRCIHRTQSERYQIYALMKSGQNQLKIAQIVGGIARRYVERWNGTGGAMKGFRSKQAQEHACQRPGGDVSSRRNFLSQDWSPEQVAGLVPVSHECLYLFIYADKAQGGTLWRSLRCHKKKRKHYAGGRDRLVRLRNRHSTHVRPAAVESRACVDHWEGDTVIGAAHKHAIVTVVEPKSGFAVLSKVKNKAPTAVSPAIIDQLKPYAARVVTLPYGVGKEFVDHARIDDELD